MKMVMMVMKMVMTMLVKVVMVTLTQQESADPGTPSVAAAIKDIKKAIQVSHLILPHSLQCQHISVTSP